MRRILCRTPRRLVVASTLWLCAAALCQISPVAATIVQYAEDFSTEDYNDAVQTTAWWDTGSASLRLYPLGISLVATYNTVGPAFSVVISGDHAVLADGDGGLVTVDVTDPADPQAGGEATSLGSARDLVVEGNFAYVAVGQSGNHKLQAFSVSDPETPVSTGWCTIPGYPHGVAKSGTYVFVAQSQFGVQSVRVTDPYDPIPVDATTTNDWAEGIAVDGDHAFVADGNAGLSVVDISDPLDLDTVANLDPGGYALGVAVAGQYAYLAAGSDGLHIVDISSPTAPALMGSCPLPGTARDVFVSGQLAYVATGTDGIQIVDISNPADPSVSTAIDTAGDAKGAFLSGHHVYAADGDAGLQVIDVDPEGFNTADNLVQSLALTGGEDPVGRARLSATVTDSVRWELSIDDGDTWDEVPPDNEWFSFATEGSRLKWRARLYHTDVPEGPTCSELNIEYEVLHNSATIAAIADIPDDQGRQVRVVWDASRFDDPDEPQPVVEYSIYRRIDPARAAPGSGWTAAIPRAQRRDATRYPPGDWDYLLTVPADAEVQYATVVPTLADSTVNDGMHWSVFFVRARTDQMGVYYDSLPDSGYSVDNLEPSTPGEFTVTYGVGGGNLLNWNPAGEDDFAYFGVYRGVTADFAVDPEHLLVHTIDSEYFDPTTGQYFYKVTSVDFAGNESAPAVAGPTAVAGGTPPDRSVLHQNQPNPFNPRTVLIYDVAAGGGRVVVEIFDLAGRRVRTLVDETQAAGRHRVAWDGSDDRGRQLAAGVYQCRLQTPGSRHSRKLTLAR